MRIKRVLSIQSHVVHGYVGNRAAVFPLQLLGFDVDFINSVNFSCHTGYDHFPHGQVMNGDQLRDIMEGLEMNGLIGNDGEDGGENCEAIGSILTGYIGSASFLEAVLDVLTMVRKYNPDARFVCDPVLGDDGSFYVPEELVELYKTVVIPKADVVTPNQFETEQLTGIKVETIDDARKACDVLHKMGPSIVFITSAILDEIPTGDDTTSEDEPLDEEKDGNKVITIIASKRSNNDGKQEMWRIDCPKIPGSFTGTGDVTACLLLGHLENNPDDLPLVMEMVINTMYLLIERTHKAKGKTVRSKELRLIQSKDIIENPPSTFKATPL
jgi:pyridoxine kinase